MTPHVGASTRENQARSCILRSQDTNGFARWTGRPAVIDLSGGHTCPQYRPLQRDLSLDILAVPVGEVDP